MYIYIYIIIVGTVHRNYRPFTPDPDRPNYDYRHGKYFQMNIIE